MALENNQRSKVRHLEDAATIRALTHPVRLALLEQLALTDELTATEAGKLIGESATTCSFHFRQLAKYGFVEEAGRGKGRERWWRLTNIGYSFGSSDAGTNENTAAQELALMMIKHIVERFEIFVRTQSASGADWSRASEVTQYLLYVTPEELADLNAQVLTLLERYRPRIYDPSERPQDSLALEALYLAFPVAFDPVGHEDPKGESK